ncbi:MAG: hypothetical protein HFH82_02660 [Lachnospiraceae bacterium]|jgi:flagellar hook-associated protein 2|nr:hypothetical protein [Lachnospiraceae bacterium]
MAINALSGYGSYRSYGTYNSGLDYQSWVNNANAQAEDLENRITSKSDSTSSSSSTSSTTSSSSTSSSSSSSVSSSVSSTSSFLLKYKKTLTELEDASKKLQAGNKNSVFTKYESALAAVSKAETDAEKEKAQTALNKAKDDVLSAITDFANKYNNAVSFLESNSDRGIGVSNQLGSLKRAMTTNDALKRVGLGLDDYGKLTVDKDKVSEVIDKNYNALKDVVGGQFGIANRAGSRASSILDSSIDTVVGSSETSKSAQQSSKASALAAATGADSSMSDYFLSYANFAKSGAYNLSNFYAVGMLLNTLA